MTFTAFTVLSVVIAGWVVTVRTKSWQEHPPQSPEDQLQQLSFRQSNHNKNNSNSYTFKIVQLTDLHYGEDPFTDWGPVQDINTTRLIHSILQWEQPIDLIVISGDQITANNIYGGNATTYYEEICQLMEDWNVPYAFIFGNHDDAEYEPPPNNRNNGDDDPVTTITPITTSRHELMDYIIHRNTTKSYLSLSQAGPPSMHGVSNYVLNVFHNDNNNNTYQNESYPDCNTTTATGTTSTPHNVVLQIMLLDSGGGSIPQEIMYQQLVWYQQQRLPYSTLLGANDTTAVRGYVDAIAFQHIPTQQFRYTTSDNKNNEYHICNGMNGENGIAPLQFDTSHEIDFLYYNDTSLHFLGVGHNHGNSYCCHHQHRTDESNDNDDANAISTTTTTTTMSNGVSTTTSRSVPLHLCFGRHSGYGGYGTWDRGARVYEITLQPNDNDDAIDDAIDDATTNVRRHTITWNSWVRLENGTITDVYEPFR